MESIAINGKNVQVQGIKELRSGMTVQDAIAKTRKNGIDEVYFQVDGKNYLAYGDALKIGDLSNNQISNVTYNGRMGTIVSYDNEVNSTWEGIKTGALGGIKKTKDALLGAVSNTITSVGPTTTTLAVGGTLALAGLSVWRTGQLAGVGAVGAAAGSPLGNIIGDVLKNGSIGALKVITVAGAIGFGVTAAAGAIGGISEAVSTEKDYSSIAAVTKDGNMATQAGAMFEMPYIAGQTPIQQTPVNTDQRVEQPVNNTPQQPGFSINVFNRPNIGAPNFNSVSTYLNQRSY